MSRGSAGFDAFVSGRYAALYRTAYLLSGSHHDAEDLLQTTLMKAAGAWRRVVGDPEPYVRTILYRENASRWRRRRLQEEPTETLPEQSAAETDRDLGVVLELALARLTPKQRSVLVLRFYEDLTEVQTAAVLGVAHGTVKSQTRHALKRLRETAPELATLLDDSQPEPQPQPVG